MQYQWCYLEEGVGSSPCTGWSSLWRGNSNIVIVKCAYLIHSHCWVHEDCWSGLSGIHKANGCMLSGLILSSVEENITKNRWKRPITIWRHHRRPSQKGYYHLVLPNTIGLSNCNKKATEILMMRNTPQKLKMVDSASAKA